MLVTLIKVIRISHGERAGTRDFYVKVHGSNHCGLHKHIGVACLDTPTADEGNGLHRVYSLF